MRTKAVDKTLKTFTNESKSDKIHEKSRISRNFTDFTKMGVFHGRRPISRKMSRPWNRVLGWSLVMRSLCHSWATCLYMWSRGNLCIMNWNFSKSTC